jgi:hypothetical protein
MMSIPTPHGYEAPSLREICCLWQFHLARINHFLARDPEAAQEQWSDEFCGMFNQLLLWTREAVFHVDDRAWPEYIGAERPCPPYPPGRIIDTEPAVRRVLALLGEG